MIFWPWKIKSYIHIRHFSKRFLSSQIIEQFSMSVYFIHFRPYVKPFKLQQRQNGLICFPKSLFGLRKCQIPLWKKSPQSSHTTSNQQRPDNNPFIIRQETTAYSPAMSKRVFFRSPQMWQMNMAIPHILKMVQKSILAAYFTQFGIYKNFKNLQQRHPGVSLFSIV